MGVALETILAVKQNLTGGAFEDLTPGSGDTFNVRGFSAGSAAYIEEVWGLDTASPAQLSIKSPRMHDQTRGVLLAVPDGSTGFASPEEPSHLLPGALKTQVYETDTLAIQVNGTAADDFLAAFFIRYDNLPGADASLHMWGEISPLIKNLVGILVQPTNGNGDYGTPVTLDSVDDRLKGNTDYAILGAVTDTPTGLISISGPDFSNYRIGLPGKTDPEDTGDFFVAMAVKYQLPHIPVLNSQNKGNTLVTTADATTGASPNVTLIMAELSAHLTR